MGNRAIITTKKDIENDGVGIYIHWNGGRDSVEGFLKYCELKGYVSPDDNDYGYARLCQVIGNFFGGDRSVGLGKLSELPDPMDDNGVYIVEEWKIVDRITFNEEQQNHKMKEMLHAINNCQPLREQIKLQGKKLKNTNVNESVQADKFFTQILPSLLETLK